MAAGKSNGLTLPARNPKVRSVGNRIGGTLKHNPNADVSELYRDLEVAKLEDAVVRVVNMAPPPTRQQLAAIAALLRPAVASCAT